MRLAFHDWTLLMISHDEKTDSKGCAAATRPSLARPDEKAPLSSLPSILVAPALVLAVIYSLHFGLYRTYFPFGDDPAVFRGSAGNVASWFTKGFSRYFIVYPEWTPVLTDFMRPGVNLIVRIEEILFGQRYLFYFAAFYVAQFSVCVLAVLVARYLGVERRWLFWVAAVTAINPAFLREGLFSVVFHFDVWCGLFAVLSLYLIFRRAYGLAVLSLTLAIFTKEPALYAPIAAAVTVFLRTRRKWLSAFMLLPLVAWLCAWRFVFTGTSAGISALPRHRFEALSKLGTGLPLRSTFEGGRFRPVSLRVGSWSTQLRCPRRSGSSFWRLDLSPGSSLLCCFLSQE
jgi:hypothetical protein